MSARKNSITAPDIRRRDMQPMGYGKAPLHRQTDRSYVPWAMAWLIDLGSSPVMPRAPAVPSLFYLAVVTLTLATEVPPVGESILQHHCASAMGNLSAGDANRKLQSPTWNKKYLHSSTADKKLAIHDRFRMDPTWLLTWSKVALGHCIQDRNYSLRNGFLCLLRLLKKWLLVILHPDLDSTNCAGLFSRAIVGVIVASNLGILFRSIVLYFTRFLNLKLVRD